MIPRRPDAARRLLHLEPRGARAEPASAEKGAPLPEAVVAVDASAAEGDSFRLPDPGRRDVQVALFAADCARQIRSRRDR